MNDVAGSPLLPFQVDKLLSEGNKALVHTLRLLSEEAKNEAEEGRFGQMLAGPLLMENLPNKVIEGLTNEKASEFFASLADVAEENPNKNLVIGSLSEGGKLIALIFNVSLLETKFQQLNVDIPQETIAGMIFQEVFVTQALRDLANQNDAVVAWEVSSYFCNTKLN